VLKETDRISGYKLAINVYDKGKHFSNLNNSNIASIFSQKALVLPLENGYHWILGWFKRRQGRISKILILKI
jgi:hypothetical protein